MTQTTESYLNLITSQYQKSTKFLQWVEALLDPIHDIATCADFIVDAFDIDTASGIQLDIIGIFLGQERTLHFQPTDGSPAYLDDAVYRKVLKLRTLTNYWDGTQSAIYDAWRAIFPDVGLLIIDNQDMSADIIFTGSLTQIVIDMINEDLIIPRPEGVQYRYGGSVGILAVFGYDMNTDFIKGYDQAVWDSSLA